LCEDGTRQFRASGGSTYRWYRNDTLVAGRTTDTLTVSLVGRYAVEAVSAAGCLSRADSVLTLVLLRRAALDFGIAGTCVDVPIRFENKSVTPAFGSIGWRWDFGNGQSSTDPSPTHAYTTTGQFGVKLRYGNSRCPAHADSLTRSLTVIRAANVRFADQVAVRGIPKPVFARDTATAWLWRPNTGLSAATIYNPQVTLPDGLTYVIQTTLRNGCIVYDTLRVKVSATTGIFVPKAFSPNGDGQNDRLFPVLVGVSQLRYFRVYNRWGVLVYEARTSGSNIGWDGVYKGVLQPLETYIWVAEALDVLGKTLKAGGNTILIR